MNLKHEEQILIKDIFAVSVNQGENSLLYLPEFVRDVSSFGRTCDSTQPTHPSSSTRLTSTPSSWNASKCRTPRPIQPDRRADLPRGKLEPRRRCTQQTLERGRTAAGLHRLLRRSTLPLTQIIKNFINLSLQEPEIFPEQLQIESDISPAPSSNSSSTQKPTKSRANC
jgi:hypothetical protein